MPIWKFDRRTSFSKSGFGKKGDPSPPFLGVALLKDC